jgi:hypothetical protein
MLIRIIGFLLIFELFTVIFKFFLYFRDSKLVIITCLTDYITINVVNISFVLHLIVIIMILQSCSRIPLDKVHCS